MESYEIEEDSFTIYQIDMPSSRISSFVEPYLFPIVLVTILSLIYIAIISIKSKKVIENVFRVIIKLVLAVGVYFSLILICRLPFGAYTMPVALSVYMITLLISVNILQK